MIYVLNEYKDNEEMIDHKEYNILATYSNLDLTDYNNPYNSQPGDDEFKYEFIGFLGNKSYSRTFLDYLLETDFIIM